MVQEIKKTLRLLADDVDRRCQEGLVSYGSSIESDPLLEKIAALYGDNVGDDFTEEEWQSVRSEGDRRYTSEIPPGYLDRRKEGDDKFGDLVIWKQVLLYAKQREKDIIFVTDDQKEDWWWKVDGKTIGPRPELRHEFQEETGRFFYAYRAEQFAQQLRKISGSRVSAEAVQEVRDTSDQAERLARYRLELAQLEQMRLTAQRDRAAASEALERANYERDILLSGALASIDEFAGPAPGESAPELEEELSRNMSELYEVRREIDHLRQLLHRNPMPWNDEYDSDRGRMVLDVRNKLSSAETKYGELSRRQQEIERRIRSSRAESDRYRQYLVAEKVAEEAYSRVHWVDLKIAEVEGK